MSEDIQRKNRNKVTESVRANIPYDKVQGYGSVPIVRTTSVFHTDIDQARTRLKDVWLSDDSTPYSANLGTPTSHHLERVISSLENGERTLLVSTGQAAISTSLLSFLKTGDHILLPDNAYGVTKNLAAKHLQRLDIGYDVYNPLNRQGVSDLIKPETTMLYMEMPGSLTFEVGDVESLVTLAKEHNLLTVFDNSWASSLGFQPLDYDIDISLQSVSKLIAGHSDVYLGSITTSDIEVYKKLKDFASYMGHYADPEACSLALRGLQTLDIRMDRQKKTALKVIDYLSKRDDIKHIFYPAWPNDAHHGKWKSYFNKAPGLFSVSLKSGLSVDFRDSIYRNLEMFNISAGWGGPTSLVWHIDPTALRHNISHKDSEVYMRFYTGLESPGELIADISKAFDNSYRSFPT